MLLDWLWVVFLRSIVSYFLLSYFCIIIWEILFGLGGIDELGVCLMDGA